MDGAHRPVVALGHGVEHGDHLVAEDFADDHPRRVHAKPQADQFGQTDPAFAFGVGVAGFHRDHVGVAFVELVEAELAVLLDGDQPFGRVDLAEQGPQKVVLPALVAPAINMFNRAAPRQQEFLDAAVEHGGARRLGEGAFALRCRRTDRHGRVVTAITANRRAPLASCRFRRRRHRVEASLGLAGAGPEASEVGHHLLVASPQCRAELLAAIGVGNPHPVAAERVDVLHPGSASSRSRPRRRTSRRAAARSTTASSTSDMAPIAVGDVALGDHLQPLGDDTGRESALIRRR